MHGESKELILRIDSLYQMEMPQIFTESGSSYKKGEKTIFAMHIIGFFETKPIPSN